MIEPTERLLWLLVVVAVVGLVGAAIPLVGDAAPFLLAGVAIAFVADALLAGSPRRARVGRAAPRVVVQSRPVEVQATLETARPLDLVVVDSLPAAALPPGAPRDVVRHVRAPAGVASWTWSIVLAARGRWRFGRTTLRALGPLGLARRRVRRVVDTEVVVVPDVAAVAASAERLLRGADEGRRARRRIAQGREFDALREYRRGDDVRLVEWKATARTGDLVVKQTTPETRQDVVVLLDAGRHLAGRHDPVDGGHPRFDTATDAALTLGAAALAKGDRVALVAFAGDVRAWVPAGEGKGHLRRLAGALEDVAALPEESDYAEAARFVVARQKRRSLVAFVTDVLDEPSARALAAAVARLRGRHLPLVVAVADPALARLARAPAPPDAPATPFAAERLAAHRARALAALRSVGAIVVDAPSPRAAASAVDAYAQAKARGRL